MSNISPISNPLMQPVQYNGQTYFTGQYFHQMYRNNSDTGGKYKRPGDFMRLVRSIETYPQYVESGDLVELTKDSVKTDANLASVFKVNHGNPVMLINATAQVALTHHLDDAVSKNASVNVNRKAVEETVSPRIGQVRLAKELLVTVIEAGRVLGTDEPMARAVAVDQVRQHTGLNMASLLSDNTVEDAPVTPTELGKELGLSGKMMNLELEREGYQARDENGDWYPTTKGEPFCTVNPYKSPNSEHTGYRVLWYRRVLDDLTRAA